MSEKYYKNFESAVIHGAIFGDPETGAVNTPIYQTSTFAFKGYENPGKWEYSRSSNPTRAILEAMIAELENAKYGFAYASGMAAITGVLSIFEKGDKIVTPKNVYGGTFRLLDTVFPKFGITYEQVNAHDIAEVEAALAKGAKALLLESPTNPLLEILDVRALCAAAKKYGALAIVDNTFMTPYLQRPHELGADIVIHSATKYLGGHSDVIAGLVTTRDDALAEQIGAILNGMGGVLQPFDSFLLLRGIKSLPVRMDRHQENAKAVANRLKENPAVEKVYYPGFEGTKDYELQMKQASGAGAMLSFELKEGYDHKRFFNALKFITLAESLGGVESLACHPASMTHASVPPEARAEMGISDRLIRVSPGIEHINDILADIEQAITAAK